MIPRAIEHYDAVVIGAGPAGCVLALSLSKCGWRVAIIQHQEAVVTRRIEVLAPAIRRLLSRMGVAEPSAGTAECSKVITAWDQHKPTVQDWSLVECVSGLAIERRSFDAELRRVVLTNDLDVIMGRLTKGEIQASGITAEPIEIRVACRRIRCAWVIDATGRSGSSSWLLGSARNSQSRMIAFGTRVRANRYSETLFVEPGPSGWWYLSPGVDSFRDLVFVTEASEIPRGHNGRRKWLQNELSFLSLIRSVFDEVPEFLDVFGMDARQCSLEKVVRGNRIAVGDAALSVDPLAGKGVGLAIEGALALTCSLVRGEATVGSFVDWCEETIRRESAVQQEMYSVAAERFDKSKYWQRLRAATSSTL